MSRREDRRLDNLGREIGEVRDSAVRPGSRQDMHRCELKPVDAPICGTAWRLRPAGIAAIVAIALSIFAAALPARANGGEAEINAMLEDCARTAVATLMRPRITEQERVDGLYGLLWGLYAADDRSLILSECARMAPEPK